MNIIRKVKQDVKKQFKIQPFSTVVMFAVLLFAVLTFFKPTVTSGVVAWIGISTLYLIILALIVFGILYYLKTKGMLKKSKN